MPIPVQAVAMTAVVVVVVVVVMVVGKLGRVMAERAALHLLMPASGAP